MSLGMVRRPQEMEREARHVSLRTSEVLYPADLDCSTLQGRWHLQTWISGVKAKDEPPVGEIGYEPFAMFTNRGDRDRFAE